MFTGIIEGQGEVLALQPEDQNLRLTVRSAFANELRIDQSVSHNGVCLTVVALHADAYEVVAVHETLVRSNLGQLRVGDRVNLERCLMAGARLDGHFVQGHVDATATLRRVTDEGGSWRLWFDIRPEDAELIVPKGSIALNGISLTVVDAPLAENGWGVSVVIIPYTWDFTNLHRLRVGDAVNVEYDILGKYVLRHRMLGNQVTAISNQV